MGFLTFKNTKPDSFETKIYKALFFPRSSWANFFKLQLEQFIFDGCKQYRSTPVVNWVARDTKKDFEFKNF